MDDLCEGGRKKRDLEGQDYLTKSLEKNEEIGASMTVRDREFKKETNIPLREYA